MSRRRTVLYVDHFPDVAGGQMALLTRLDHLDRERWRPVVVVPETRGRLHEELADRNVDTIPVQLNRGDVRGRNEKGILSRPVELAGRLPHVAVTGHHLRRLLQREGVDLVHTNSFKGALLVTLPALVTGTPMIYHAHSSRAYSDHGVLDHVVCGAAERIVANSEFTARTFSQWTDKTEVVYNAVDAERFVPESVDTDAVRRSLDCANGPLVGSVGRLTPRKRQTDLIRAFPTIRESFPDAELVLVGGKYDGLGSEYERRVSELVADLGLEDVVHFTGFVEDVAATIASFDILVHPAEKEPLGRVVIESLLLETPVVATNDGGIPEIVDHEETGLLVPPKDPPAIADAVARLLNDPAWAASMARAGRTVAADRFDAETITRAEARIYEDVLADQ